MVDMSSSRPSSSSPQVPCSTWPQKSLTRGRGAMGSQQISGPWAAPSSRWQQASPPSTSWAAPRLRCSRYPWGWTGAGGGPTALKLPLPPLGWLLPLQPPRVPPLQVGMFKMHPEVPASMSDNAKAFILRCFQADPAERATATALLQEPFLASARRARSRPVPPVGGESGGAGWGGAWHEPLNNHLHLHHLPGR